MNFEAQNAASTIVRPSARVKVYGIISSVLRYFSRTLRHTTPTAPYRCSFVAPLADISSDPSSVSMSPPYKYYPQY